MTMFADEELFFRDLAEVHLLMDHISGHPDKSLADLAGRFAYDPEGRPYLKAVSAHEVIDGICQISYPPEGSQAHKAHQAAFALTVKDVLNVLARPAKGMTVAFTLMFSGISLPRRHRGEKRLALIRRIPQLAWLGKLIGGGGDGAGADGRPEKDGAQGADHKPPADRALFFSAQRAYPNLEAPARRFRRDFKGIPFWAGFIIIVIAYLNWDAGITNALLSQVTNAESDYAKLYSPDRKFLPTAENCRFQPADPAASPAASPQQGSPDPTAAQAPSGQDVSDSRERASEGLLCRQATLLSLRHAIGLRNLKGLVASSHDAVGFVEHPFAFWVYEFQPEQPTPDVAADRSGALDRLLLEDTANAVLHAFNVIILPMLFGLLGTLVGVARSVSSKVRLNVLAPRDHMVMRVSVVLGMSAGLAVGLIFNPGDSGEAISRQFGGAISISSAGLSFLAGLGSEAVFGFLDKVIDRVFTMPEATSSGTAGPVRPSVMQPSDAAGLPSVTQPQEATP